MDSSRAVAAAGALLALASLVLALVEYEGIMAVVSVVTLVYGLVASKRCPPDNGRYILITALAALACTVLSITVLSQGNFTDDGGDPTTAWFVVIGLVHSVPVALLTFETYVVFASLWGASYNWAVVRGLSPFIGMGLEVPGFILEYVFEGADNWMTDNGYILYHFLMTLVVMILVSYPLSKRMRGCRTIITENGAEELKC